MNDESPLRDDLRGHLDAMLADLAALVAHESPSSDKPALDALARHLGARLAELGAEVEYPANPGGGDHVAARFDFGAAPGVMPALILAHFDTVWPVGTLARKPFRVKAGKAFGPGVFDMKASLVLVESALAALVRLGRTPPRPVVVLFTSDEEVGSPDSRHRIEAQARDSAYTLVVEPPLHDGSLKTARKGTGRYSLEVRGLAAHAGVEPQKGRSAIQELAHQILRLPDLADLDRGTTLNVGLIRGGTASNTVPAFAAAQIDARAASLAEADRIDRGLRELAPIIDGCSLAVSGGFNRPPMERTPAVADLFARARAIGLGIGLDLGEGSTGGGSDANFTAALGVPTLDGLGVRGAGAHADHEHILIDSLPERAALLATLLLGL